MSLYIHYIDNIFAGFYDSNITDQIPEPNIKIDLDQHLDLFNRLSNNQSIKVGDITINPQTVSEVPITWDQIRSTRDKKLSACDWTQLKDVSPILSSNWQSYRQALRDIPQAYTDPNAVVWPKEPNT